MDFLFGEPTFVKSLDLTMHHLDRTDGAIRAIAYDQESLEGALSIPMEVRG